jgi:GT2 family glycosyltransferase
MSDVAAIVLDLDGGAMLEECLASIDGQSDPPRRVIVFDNGSLIPVRERLRSRSDRFELEILRSETNLGFSGGVNAAFERVTEPMFALINNDVVLDSAFFGEMVRALDRDDVAGVQSVIRMSDGRIDGAGIDVANGTFRQSLHGAIGGELRDEIWGVSATASLYRTAAIRAASKTGVMFHPAFFAYYEDVELCARLREQGMRFGLVPRALATHRGSQSAERIESLRLRVRNRYFVNRLHSATGSWQALLREDVARLARATLRLQLGAAARTIAAIREGLTAPIHPI